jgi:hypothetical protein
MKKIMNKKKRKCPSINLQFFCVVDRCNYLLIKNILIMSWINTNNCMPLDNLTGELTCPDSTAAPNGTLCDIEQVCYIGVSYLLFSYGILTLFSLKYSVNFIFILLLSDFRNYEQIWNIRVQLMFSLRRCNDLLQWGSLVVWVE